MMSVLDSKQMDQMFIHLSNDNELMVINTSALTRHLMATNTLPEWIAIQQEQADFIERSHGVDKKRLELITDEHLNFPVISIEFIEGTYLLIDGNHRVVYAARQKKTEILGWLVPQSVWKDYVMNLFEVLRPEDLHTYVAITLGREIPYDTVITVGRY